MASVNVYRRDHQKKLDNLTADLKNLGRAAPYNSLFDLMEKHCVEYAVDLSLEYPCEIGANKVAHLRPGRMLSFRDADGEMVKMAFRECERCNKVKKDRRDEYFEFKCCLNTNRKSVCRDCTTQRCCFTCRRILMRS
jgi:hypothetical protein